MSRILHIIDRLSGAGPTRSLISLAKYQARLGLPHQHDVVTLERDNYPLALLMAKRAGLNVRRHPSSTELDKSIAAADIVQVHFWNNPTNYRFLRRSWPEMRCLVRLHIFGHNAPQAITQHLLDAADFIVAAAPGTLRLDNMREMRAQGRVAAVPGVGDFERLSGMQRRRGPSFQVGYIGTANFSKMHPRFVPMHAAIKIDDLRVVVCGSDPTDQLQRQALQLGAKDRFQFNGYVENIKSVLESLDVFGYPLCPETYATSEVSLQEAMFAEVPPVVFPYGGIPDLVRHDVTGLVVNSEPEYVQAVQHLHRHPEKRRRLGRAGREFVLQTFAPESVATAFDDVYRRVVQLPKRKRNRLAAGQQLTGAEQFVASLGDSAPQFAESWKLGSSDAEREIGEASAHLAGGEGGLFHYRNTFPDDPYLHFWSGLVLLQQHRFELAAAEFDLATRAGLDSRRTSPYLARARGELQSA